MKFSDDSSIRLRGQRSLTSAFLSTSSNPNLSKNSQRDAKAKISNLGTKVSLSDILNRKLHRSSVLPNSSKDKESLISPIVTHGDVIGEMMKSNEVKEGPKKGVEADKFPLEFVLEQFKCSGNTKEDPISLSGNEEVGSSILIDLHETRKRKNSRSLITIGDDPKTHNLNLTQEKERFISEKKPRLSFNHYGSGRGWWDGNMEGVDNEELGSVETWEGVGSATLGGLKWH